MATSRLSTVQKASVACSTRMPKNSATPPAMAQSASAIVAASQCDRHEPRVASDQHGEALHQPPDARQAELVAQQLQRGGARPQQHAVEVAGAHELRAEHVEAAGEQVGDREGDADQRRRTARPRRSASRRRAEAVEQRPDAEDLDDVAANWPTVSIKVAAGYCDCARSEAET